MGATAAQVDALRRHIARLERTGVVENAALAGAPPLRFGVAAVDDALPAPGGLAGGRLHELRGGGDQGLPQGGAPATAVTAALAAGTVRRSGKAAAWIAKPETLFLPGLAEFGLRAPDLIVITPQDDAGALWAAEECLRSGGLSCVVAEIAELSLTASRRLQLAAEVGACTGLLLRGDAPAPAAKPPPTVCATSWHVTALPGGAGLKPNLMGPARWALDLQRCRNGVPQSWNLEWCDDTRCFRLATPVRHGPMVAPPATGLAQAS